MDKNKQDEVLKEIQPLIAALLRKMEKISPSLCFSGFIYSMNPPLLAHVSNIDQNIGIELVRLHYQLSYLYATQSQTDNKNFQRVNLADLGKLVSNNTSEEIADKLSLSLLSGLPADSEEVNNLVESYIKSRRRQ